MALVYQPQIFPNLISGCVKCKFLGFPKQTTYHKHKGFLVFFLPIFILRIALPSILSYFLPLLCSHIYLFKLATASLICYCTYNCSSHLWPSNISIKNSILNFSHRKPHQFQITNKSNG